MLMHCSTTTRILTSTILWFVSLALMAPVASAHPSSGIVVDQQGQVYFQDIVGRAIWKIDAQGKLTKFYDKLGGHWMALDAGGSLARANVTPFKRITPFGERPTLLVADGGAPIAVNAAGILYYGLVLEGRNVARGLTRISPDGKRTPVAPELKQTLEKMDEGVFGLATGPNGSVYVSSWDALFKVSSKGTVATVVHPVVVKDCDEDRADHKPTNRLPYLRGIAVDETGTIYAAATSCHRVLKITPDGKVESVLRSERPWSPTGVALHAGAVYVLEYTNANGGPAEGWQPRVRKIGRDGRVTTLATIPGQR
jgi:sugar lactone lactonase YvrE